MHSASTDARGPAAGARGSAADVLVSARGLALGYGGEPVVEGVSLEIRAGEAWCLMGPNGCGKSTLLRGLLGLLAPQAGALALAPRLRDRAGVGYVPQRSELNGALPTTVRELVALGLVGSGVPRAERARAVAAALEEVGIQTLASRSFWALSGGQRQRAFLARALARQPELLVLDEPTEGLDVGTEAALRALLDRLRASGRLTLILVTHRPELARAYADHVALFAEGRVVTGPREAVLG